MKHPFIRAVVAAALLGAVSAAHAVPELRFKVDADPVISCLDQAACDQNAAVGAVTYINTALGPFSVSVTTGVSKSLVSGNPLLDLNTLDVTALPGVHTLTIGFSDSGFDAQGQLSLALGGTLNGAGASVWADAYYSTTDGTFNATTLIGTLGPFTGPVFADTLFDGLAPAAPYSVSQFIVLTTSATEATSLNAGFVVNVPEPTTLALLGLGLVAFGFRLRRQAA